MAVTTLHLRMAYIDGNAGYIDIEQGMSWLRKAAAQGDREAQEFCKDGIQ